MYANPDYKFGHVLERDFSTRRSPGRVGLIMGSVSDWLYIQQCADTLEELNICFEYGVVSAHRTTSRLREYAQMAMGRGLMVVIACAGGSAHLPGMVASETLLPVLAVSPLKSDDFAVGSMIAMPAGKPLGYMGGGSSPNKNAGAVNAALMAARILALSDQKVLGRVQEYDRALEQSVPFHPH